MGKTRSKKMVTKGDGGSRIKKYIEFYGTEIDGCVSVVNALNKFISENKHLKVSVIGYQVVRYELANTERTYILAEVEE